MGPESGYRRCCWLITRDDDVMEWPRPRTKGIPGIAAGLIDLIDAGFKGSVKINGGMRIVIRDAELVNVVYGVYARETETAWPKGKPVATPPADASAAH